MSDKDNVVSYLQNGAPPGYAHERVLLNRLISVVDEYQGKISFCAALGVIDLLKEDIKNRGDV